MTHISFKTFLTVATMLTTLLMTACVTGTPQDGRYQSHDGGGSNFRAEAIPAPINVITDHRLA
jgi:hypothetical protein